MLERNRPRIYTVRRGCSSLKDNQREELHQVDKTQQAKEDGGRESDGAELLLEEREGEVEQQGKYTSVNGRDLELPAATTDAIASGLRQTEQAHAKDREEEDDEDMSGAVTGTTVAAIVLLLGIVGIFDAVGFLYREQINDILTQYSDFLEGYGSARYVLFVLGYAGLELVLAIPAVPLTMSAGLLFGTLYGTMLLHIRHATVSFLIARYLARDRILAMVKDNKKFLAIDKAIDKDGFRVVTLLRLSPLLPFSIGNYLYGLTSVKLLPYVLGSWLGLLPGTWAYVRAGATGRASIKQVSEAIFPGDPQQYWTVGIGLVATVVAASYVSRLAKDVIKEIE
ncbi:unnamed protein product [Sphagnum compactum]